MHLIQWTWVCSLSLTQHNLARHPQNEKIYVLFTDKSMQEIIFVYYKPWFTYIRESVSGVNAWLK